MKEFGTSRFSLTKLHQLTKDSQFPVAQRHFQRLYREVLNTSLRKAEESFTIHTRVEEPPKITLEQLETYCSLPFMDKQGNRYELKPSKSNELSESLTIEFRSKHFVKDAQERIGEISGILTYDSQGRLISGLQNRFAPCDPKYSFVIEYPEDGGTIATGICQPLNKDSQNIFMENMPFFTIDEPFLMVDIAEVKRQIFY